MSDSHTTSYEHFPLLPVMGMVAFPKNILRFEVAQKLSVHAIKAAVAADGKILVATQFFSSDAAPSPEELASVGCVAKIEQVFKMPDGSVRVEAKALFRAVISKELIDFDSDAFLLTASATRCVEYCSVTDEIYPESLLRKVQSLFNAYCEIVEKIPPEVPARVNNAKVEDLGEMCDFAVFNTDAPVADRQNILEELNKIKRAELVINLLEHEIEIEKVNADIEDKVKKQMDDNNREYYLREQIRAINTELYGDGFEDTECDEYINKINELNAPQSIKDKLIKEVGKLMKMPQGSVDSAALRGYLDVCLELPYNTYTAESSNVKTAREILDRDFYGMEKVKERILESLSVYALAPDVKGQILCLVGPPGVGKTSIGKCIAECTGRNFARISLGGVKDEAEIRGHRRTYVASMPGKIINAIRTAGSGNPVILLDEVDKLGNDYKGDPSSALLEVLDPEQNVNFTDHYLDMPYDLSKVLFIATANTVENIPLPLLDRMEIIELASYTFDEKFNIAKKHLLPRQIARHGLNKSNFKITDKAIKSVIEFYTKEAGVRKLEQQICAICRKAAKQIVESKVAAVKVDESAVVQMLGHHKYLKETLLRHNEVGVVNGLAWTSVGGEIMQLEVAVCKGTGSLELTGSLGEVMQESAKAAVTFVRCNAAHYGINPDFYKDTDIHIHATEAAVPKDGPSAGVTIVTALISALTGTEIRRDVAMTGEVTVRGRVLPIGGLKEKSMAAYKAGVKKVFIPAENEADIDEIDDVVKNNIQFIPVNYAEEVVRGALAKPVKVQSNHKKPAENQAQVSV